jgi:hypothetical protein
MNLLTNNITGIFQQTPFIDVPGFTSLLLRFLFNLLVAVIIVRYIYYSKARRKDYLFTYLLINVVVFLLSLLLSGVELKLGFAFGLFALFGILRYRTHQIPIKEMTYLFVVIGTSVLNSMSGQHIPWSNLLFSNFAIIILLWVLENAFLLSHESSKSIVYEKIELIKEENRDELIDDLKERTGINIHRVDVESINFMRDTARLIIYYYDKNRIMNVDDRQFDDDGDENF